MMAGATKAYLHPWLRAAGAPTRDPQGDEYVMWPDTSELVVAPDRTTAADQAHDRGAITDEAYRREKGFGESDKPDDQQLERIILTRMAMNDPTNGPAALEQLTGAKLAGPTGPGEGPGVQPPDQPAPVGSPGQPTPPPNRNPDAPRATPSSPPGP
jgi:hypothetical protein